MLTPLIVTLVLVPAVQGELKILDTPDGKTGPAPCALTCSGVGRWNDTDPYCWLNSGYHPAKVYRHVDIRGCNFVSAPVVTTTTGSISFTGLCPSVTVTFVNSKQFNVYSVEDVRASKMLRDECSVYWTATGYNC